MGHEAINNVDMSELGDDLNDELARTGLINALMRLQNLAKKQADALQKLSPSVRKRVEILREIQGQRDELDALFLEERAAIVAKFQKLYEPFHANRCNIVNGVISTEDTEGVPDFWLTALKNNPVVGKNITEGDEGVLKYLRDVKCCRLEEEQNKGFKLEFYFDINPYFKNTVLTKTYYMIDEDEPVLLEKAVGTKIEWFPGLKQKPKEEESKEAESVPETEDQKEKSSNNSEQISETEDKDGSKKSEPITASESEDHNEGSNNAEQISETENKEESKNSEPVTETDEDKEESKNGFEANTETEENEGSKNGEATTGIEDDEEKDYCESCSFLINFFNPPQVPDDDDDEDIDKDAINQELQNQMEQDYYIGSTIGDKIIPHAVSWFTGEAIQPYDLEYIEDESDEDEEDDDDDKGEDENKEEDKDNDENKEEEKEEDKDEIKEEEKEEDKDENKEEQEEGKIDDEEESNIGDGQ